MPSRLMQPKVLIFPEVQSLLTGQPTAPRVQHNRLKISQLSGKRPPGRPIFCEALASQAGRNSQISGVKDRPDPDWCGSPGGRQGTSESTIHGTASLVAAGEGAFYRRNRGVAYQERQPTGGRSECSPGRRYRSMMQLRPCTPRLAERDALYGRRGMGISCGNRVRDFFERGTRSERSLNAAPSKWINPASATSHRRAFFSQVN